MINSDTREAWLETSDGRPWPLGMSCSIGRAASNHIVIDHQHVSRRHAVVHRQDRNEYWLVDLGSSNGSFINDLRIAMPTRLRDGDSVRIGETQLTFRQASSGRSAVVAAATHAHTVIEAKSARCWLLVADIVGSTQLATQHEPARWASLVGAWTEGCRRIVESNGGQINKYLGDGFLAFWPREGQQVAPIARALGALLDGQGDTKLPFRMALHYGDVMLGGARSLGEDSISGLELVFLFRMEKAAGALNRSFLCSEAAASRLQPFLPLEFAGEHKVSGFVDAQPRRFFGVRGR